MGGKAPVSQQEIAIEPRDERVLHHFAALCRARHALTARQSEVLYTIALGHTYRPQLARALGISPGGLRWHMGNIYRQLGINAVGGTASPLLVMRVWPLLARARAKIARERREGEDAVVGGASDGRDADAGAHRPGDVGADGALRAASIPPLDERMGTGGAGA